MATFFGEVLSVYSRAVEEDEEDLDENEEDAEIRRELEEKREVNLHWSPEVSESLKSGNKLPCSDFILAVGHNAARFLSVYALTSENWDALGRASVWNERSGGVASEESACVFYRPKDNPAVLICQVTCYLAEDQLFQWTEKVFDCLQLRQLNVTVLSESSVSDLRRRLPEQQLGSLPALAPVRCFLWEACLQITGAAQHSDWTSGCSTEPL
ncbi:Proteasome assembly chaperone 1 [Dissostichus eleginoides]|uniref:Proteasome assembly chaperone 1 n=1 Tax=Dissostichus eleginoides TaxID=100907 RepID=A0AAD9BHU4_DISEL|nr:Proteasome assembly chaperone 1 [Dissostichus eleginoides]